MYLLEVSLILIQLLQYWLGFWYAFYDTGIQREEEKVKRSMKEAAKKGNKDVCIILAKEILRSRKTINKLITSKTHMSSIQMQMKNQLCKFLVNNNTFVVGCCNLYLTVCTSCAENGRFIAKVYRSNANNAQFD